MGLKAENLCWLTPDFRNIFKCPFFFPNCTSAPVPTAWFTLHQVQCTVVCFLGCLLLTLQTLQTKLKSYFIYKASDWLVWKPSSCILYTEDLCATSGFMWLKWVIITCTVRWYIIIKRQLLLLLSGVLTFKRIDNTLQNSPVSYYRKLSLLPCGAHLDVCSPGMRYYSIRVW